MSKQKRWCGKLQFKLQRRCSSHHGQELTPYSSVQLIMHWLVRRSKFAVLPNAKARVMATFRAMQEAPLAVFEANSQALMKVGNLLKADVRVPLPNHH
jgi:hypothetical protein